MYDKQDWAYSDHSFVCIDLAGQAVDLEAVSDRGAILFVELDCVVDCLRAHCLTNDCVILVGLFEAAARHTQAINNQINVDIQLWFVDRYLKKKSFKSSPISSCLEKQEDSYSSV